MGACISRSSPLCGAPGITVNNESADWLQRWYPLRSAPFYHFLCRRAQCQALKARPGARSAQLDSCPTPRLRTGRSPSRDSRRRPRMGSSRSRAARPAGTTVIIVAPAGAAAACSGARRRLSRGFRAERGSPQRTGGGASGGGVDNRGTCCSCRSGADSGSRLCDHRESYARQPGLLGTEAASQLPEAPRLRPAQRQGAIFCVFTSVFLRFSWVVVHR